MSDAEEDLINVDSSQSYISKLYKKLKSEQERAILNSSPGKSLKTKFNINHKNLIQISAKEPNAPSIPGHLASPITADDQIFLLTYDKFFCRRHKFFKNIIIENNIKFHLNGVGHRCKTYPCLTSLVKSNFSREVQAKHHLLERQFDKIYDLALLSFHIKKFDFLLPVQHLISYQTSVAHNIEMFNLQTDEKKLLLSLFQDKLMAEYYKDKICNKRIPFSKLLYVNEDLLLEKDTSLLYCNIHKTKLLAPTSQVIMVLDSLQARFSLVLYWILSDKVNKYPGYSIRKIGLRIVNYFEHLRDNVLGSEFYSFISKWEALVLGYVISDPLDLGNNSLYLNIKNDMEIVLHQTLPTFLLPSSFYLNEIKLYLELTGITKIFGHPCIDMEKSLDVVRMHGGTPSKIETIDITNVVATIIEHFVKNYRNKHGYYPKIQHAPSRLRHFFKTQEIIQRSHRIETTDWLGLVFDKNFDFDYSFDTSVFIKDTALAVPMSQWASSFDTCAFKVLYNKPRPPHNYSLTGKRLILKYLKGTEGEIYKKVHEIENNYWDPDGDTAIYCRKERELKPEGRVFVKQEYRQRLAQVIREHNIADTIFPYFEDQTMTDSEITLLRKQQAMSSYGGEGFDTINIDLSKWNLKFRYNTVHRLGVFLDQLFGFTKFYSEAHRWFLRAKIFCNSRLCPPDYDSSYHPIPGKFFINNHKGGGEGMCQKFWTLINIGVIRLTEKQVGVRVNVMGQGDNQVVVLKYRKSQIIDKALLREQFMQSLDSNFSKIGLKLKLEETWYSNRLFEYGKVRYYKGDAISQGTKKLSRLIPDINDGISTFQSGLCSINTTTENAVKTEVTADVAFFLNQFECLNYLFRKGITQMGDYDTDILKCMFFPVSFGGLPLSTYFNHTIRGHDDPLTMWLHLFTTLQTVHPEIWNRTLPLLAIDPRPRRDYTQLLQDIRGLNVKPLDSVESEIKNQTAYLLRTNSTLVTNPEIKRLYDPTCSLSIDYITDVLITMKPLFLPLAHELLRLSNSGSILTLQNKLVNVTTVNKLVEETTQEDFNDISNTLLPHIVASIRERNIINSAESVALLQDKVLCPVKKADILRFKHWGLELLTPSKPNPLHQIQLHDWDEILPPYRRKSYHTTVSSYLQTCGQVLGVERGISESYIGKKTTEKLTTPTAELTARTSEIISYQQLVNMQSWAERLGSVNLSKFIGLLMQEKSYLLPSSLHDLHVSEYCPQVKSGNLIHRFKAATEKRAGIRNTTPTSGSHFTHTTNCMQDYVKGGLDYTIYFQLTFLLTEALIVQLKLHGIPICPQYGTLIVCPDCTQDITSIELDLSICPVNTLVSPLPTLKRFNTYYSLENFINEATLTMHMSVVLGRIIGQDFDRSQERSTNLNEKIITLSESSNLRDVSVFFFKYCDFYGLLIGILQSSHQFRLLYLKADLPLLLVASNTALKKTAQMFLETNRIPDFFLWSGQETTDHTDAITAEKFSSKLFQGFMITLHKNLSAICKTLLKYTYPNDTYSDIISIINWIILINRKSNLQLTGFPSRLLQYNQSTEVRNYRLLNQDHETELGKRTTIPNRIIITNCLKSNVIQDYWLINPWPSIVLLPAFKELAVTHQFNEPSALIPASRFHSIHCEPEIITSFFTPIFYQSVEGGIDRRQTQNSCLIHIKYVHHIARTIGRISSASPKYLEAISLLGISPDLKPDIAFNLAEGSGSVALLFSRYFNCPIGYNTLLTPEVDYRPQLNQLLPPTMLGSTAASRQQIRFQDLLCTGETDITKDAFIKKFKGCSSVYSRVFITIDAETTTVSNNFEILQIYLAIFKESDNLKLLICKIFLRTREWKVTLLQILKRAIGYNTEISYGLLKPLSSHPGNAEYLLIVMRLTAFPNDTVFKMRQVWSNTVESCLHVYPMDGFTIQSLEYYLANLLSLRSVIHDAIIIPFPELQYIAHDFSVQSILSGCSPYCVKTFPVYSQLFNLCCERLSPGNEVEKNFLTRGHGEIAIIEKIVYHLFGVFLTYMYSSSTHTGKDLAKLLMVLSQVRIHIEYPYKLNTYLYNYDQPEVNDPYLLDHHYMKNIYKYLMPCTCADNNELLVLPITVNVMYLLWLDGIFPTLEKLDVTFVNEALELIRDNTMVKYCKNTNIKEKYKLFLSSFRQP